MDINLRTDAPDQTDIIDPTLLSETIEQLKTVGAQVLAAEIKLKELKSQYDYISGITIPQLMDKMNLKTLKLKDGSELSVKNRFFASIRADKKAEAIKWLRDNGLGDIVDNNISVSFGQGEDNKAVDYVNLARSGGFEPIQEEKVHPQTLKVVMKEWKDKGHEVPEELFNTFDGNQTYLKNKK